MRGNPFTPGFGSSPLVLAGRDDILDEFRVALEGPGRESGSILLIAGRGSGKTVLLNRLQGVAGEYGWLWVQEDGRRGLVERVTAQLEQLSAQLDPPPKRRLNRVDITAVGGVGWESVARAEPVRSLRAAWERTLDRLAATVPRNAPAQGVLLTVDEIHHADVEEMNELGQTFQHLLRAERPVAFAGAGLPGPAMERLLTSEGAPTFLLRSWQPHEDLAQLPDTEVVAGLQGTAALGGKRFDDEALALAVEAIAGFPYMLQLLGQEAWRAPGTLKVIRAAHVHQAIPIAHRRLGQNIVAVELRGLSGQDLQFLLAMAQDPANQPSHFADIRDRMGVDKSYASRYRDRLLRKHVIRSVGYGLVEFNGPGMREFLREHASQPALGRGVATEV